MPQNSNNGICCAFYNLYKVYLFNGFFPFWWIASARNGWFYCLYTNSAAVTAILGMLTAVNEHIISTTSTQIHTVAEPPSFPYSLCITLLKDLETLVEVAAQHIFGEDKKWNFIAATEATK